MSTEQTIGVLARYNINWTAGILYLNTIAQALQHLPADNRPGIRLIQTTKEKAKSKNQLAACFHSGALFYDRWNASLQGSVRQAMLNLIGKKPKHGSLEQVIAQHQITCVFPCQKSLGRDFPVPWIGWIPDFQHKHYPDNFSEKERDKRDKRYQRLVDEAPLIVVSSHCAKEDIIRYYNASPNRVRVYSFCTYPDPTWFEPNARDVADKLGLPEKYLMFPSRFWIHKNHLNLLKAIEKAKDQYSDIALVLTGRGEDFRHTKYAAELKAKLNSKSLRDHVFWLGLLPRIEQIQVMRCAAAIVQPSFFEGWSMLVEDARSLGKPIYISDIPVHREQNPGQATFFAPQDPADLHEVICNSWPSITPGPIPTSEAEAKSEINRQLRKNAQTLTEIFDEALEIGSCVSKSLAIS